jgi:hypothetical protein
MPDRDHERRRVFLLGIFVPGIFVPGIFVPALAVMATTWATSPGQAAEAVPVPMDLDAVTLELTCRDGAVEGEFHPIHAKMLDAATWGGNQRSEADLSGYAGQAGRRRQAGRANRPQNNPAQNPPAAQQAPVSLTVLATLKPLADDATLEIDTSAGKAAIRVKDVVFAAPKSFLDGKIVAQRLPSATRIAASPSDNDYPAITRDRAGSLWVAYVSYKRGGEPDMAAAARGDFSTFVPTGNGDQIWLVKFDGKEWSVPLTVTAPLLDLWKPSVTVGGAGQISVAWSQQTQGNWDIYRRSYDPARNQWSPIERVTSDPGADVNVVSTTDSTGKVWSAWQGRRGKHFQIFLTGAAEEKSIAVTDQPANHWAPAIAADSKGNVYVAWDSYQNGNYDVFLRRFHNGEAEPVVPIGTLKAFEARPSIAVDRQDRVWIAYEQGGPNWGKDFGRVVPKAAKPNPQGGNQPQGGNNVGIPLYLNRHIVVKCYADGRLQRPAANPEVEMNAMPRPKSHARVMAAADGRIWLLFRHHPLPGGMRETWAEYAMSYDGAAWSKPLMLANSDGIMDNRPALAPFGRDAVMAVFSSDWRLRGANNLVPDGRLPLKADLYATLLRGGTPPVEPQLAAAAAGANNVQPVHPHESQEIEGMRAYRVEAGGKTYQLARGEFHRHTEYTAHRDGDGTLEDMWRYAQDAADMDWLGNGDHDNGFGHQYPWWITQKTMDIYHNPPWFISPYTYERSCEWPNGHRNVIFTQRGVRTLPRGDMKGDEKTGTPDTKTLYAYLHHFDGICASHTSATNMGTDWRDSDPLVEPVVEVYQGDRNNYECEGAPRGITLQQAAAGHVGPAGGGEAVHPKGFIWNALAKGIRIGFESSSDHISTHSSYAVLLVEKPGRESIREAFRARRCFAATDNIRLVVRCGEHLMGEEFQLAGRPTLDMHVAGTAPIARLEIIRNNRYVFSTEPNRATVDLQWTDAAPPSEPVNYYYVRILQADGGLAWSSPMWIHPQGK